jgi:Transposase DDE domain/Domain of unknown function (DUF4372)
MAWILLGFEGLPTFETAKGAQAMPHQNTVYHSLLKALPRWRFDRLAEEHCGSYRDRRLSFWAQFVALAYAQLAGVQSLRQLVAELGTHGNHFYHLGLEDIRRSTLSDANRDRPAKLFEAVFDLLLPQITGDLGREAKDLIRLIDATSLKLGENLSKWAYVSAGNTSAKLHLVYDPQAVCPTYFAVTPARVHDIVEAKKIPIEPGATYVFDLGYYDYGWWAELHEAGCRVVTRFKRNTPLEVVKELPLPKGSTILSDRIGYLPQRQAKNRRNPFRDPVREVRVMTENGRILRLFCNDLDATAQEIADLYKMRWQIELFFKWIKQNLRIKKFIGTSENAVRIQVITALIAFLLVRIAHRSSACKDSLHDLLCRLRTNLLHRKPMADILRPPTRRSDPDPQFSILFARA